MERFSHRESVLLGYSPQKLLMNSSSSPKSPYRNSDIDFNDVFGGPPRRSSMPEITDSVAFKGDDEAETSRSSSWSGLSEKPVFGEEGVNRRNYPSQDFFDDIFRGSLTSSPRMHDRDPYSSAPGSRVLSPARPLPPRAEPFGSSLPAQFSLPAKLSKGTDLPIFGSSTRSQCKYKDGAPNDTSSYSYSPLSRFSSQANQGDQEDSRNDVRPSYRQSPLFQELSLSSDESSNFTKSDETNTGGNAKKDASSSEVSTNGSRFHFSIYKWARKGVPLVMPLRGNSSRLKEVKTERCSSSNGRIESMARELSTATSHDIDLPSSNNRISASTESFGMECDKQVNDSLLDTSTQDSTEPCQIVEEAILLTSHTETLSNLTSTVKNAPDTVLQYTREQTKPHSLPESAFSEKTEKETSVTPKETQKPELKPLFSLFFDNDDDQDIDDITGKAKGKESTVKSTKKSSLPVDVGKSIKKQDGKRTSLDTREVNKARLQGSHAKSGDLGKNSVKGKVKEFVKLFNQEAISKPKFDIDSQSQSFRRKERGTSREESEVSVNTSGTNERMCIPNVHAKKTMPDAPIMVDAYFKRPEKQHSAMMKTNYLSNDTSSEKKDTSASSTASISNASKATVGDTEESFHGNFMIKELTQYDNKPPQTGDDPEDIQVIDTKIRQWSYGKEGNIRSLLSTLQYVLWPESGWKPVPLVDIIEGNAVKRSYQKALLCLHPDKLQQKGAASPQKYIAEKVFDILQDAWTHFNSLGSL